MLSKLALFRFCAEWVLENRKEVMVLMKVCPVKCYQSLPLFIHSSAPAWWALGSQEEVMVVMKCCRNLPEFIIQVGPAPGGYLSRDNLVPGRHDKRSWTGLRVLGCMFGAD